MYPSPGKRRKRQQSPSRKLFQCIILELKTTSLTLKQRQFLAIRTHNRSTLREGELSVFPAKN